jgi:hypothetical protein
MTLLVAASLSAAAASAQDCSSFAWSVTAAPVGGGNVAVSVCGRFAGCRPHNPQFAVEGSVIRVFLTQAELPDCSCIAVVDAFQVTTIVPDVAPGEYQLEAVRVRCGQQEVAGTGTLVNGAASIPTLDDWGFSVFSLLLAVAAYSRMRA